MTVAVIAEILSLSNDALVTNCVVMSSRSVTAVAHVLIAQSASKVSVLFIDALSYLWFLAAKLRFFLENYINCINFARKIERKQEFVMDSQIVYTFEEAMQSFLAAVGGREHLLEKLLKMEQQQADPVTEKQLSRILNNIHQVLPEGELKVGVGPQVVEVRPQELECDVVRFQNNKEKWVALVGLLNGYPYEIFTGLQDDDEGIMIPKSVSRGKIVKQTNADGTKRYDFQFTNTRGYKITVEGLSERFNPEYWNYAKLISGVLRYRMPIEHVIKLVGSLQLQSENINTWKNGVERALKKYLPAGIDIDDSVSEAQ